MKRRLEHQVRSPQRIPRALYATDYMLGLLKMTNMWITEHVSHNYHTCGARNARKTNFEYYNRKLHTAYRLRFDLLPSNRLLRGKDVQEVAPIP